MHFSKRAGVWILSGSILLAGAGCETTNPFGAKSNVQLTPAEQRMREDEDRFNKTVIGGVLVGAAVGGLGAALVTKLAGGNDRQVAGAAVAGAAVGGTVGGMDGYSKAKLEQSGRNEVRAIQSAAGDMKKDNEKLQAFLDSSNQVLAEGKGRLAALRDDVAQKRVSVADAAAARKREERNIDSMAQALVQAKKTRDDYKTAASNITNKPAARRDLDEQISKMDQQISQLERNVADYSQALKVSKA